MAEPERGHRGEGGARRDEKLPHGLPRSPAEPHLLVAQRLKPMQFIRMWMELEYSQFNGRFMADSMLLLRRSELNKRYEVVRRMEFLSLPLNVKQGELFG